MCIRDRTAEDGYDYTFYNEDYQEDDGGIYDNPTIYVDKAASDILEDKGLSLIHIFYTLC